MEIKLFYILNEHGEPKQEPDFLKWGMWMADAKRDVSFDSEVGGYAVSTVFLGIDQSGGVGIPLLWETMVFGDGDLNLAQDRCGGSREQAEAMHAAMVQRVCRHTNTELPAMTKSSG